jgi:annexin A7/11
MKSAYRSVYHKDLTAVIRSELSVKTERLFNMALVGNREETDYVDQARVQQDVHALYKAGQGQMGTDEITM